MKKNCSKCQAEFDCKADEVANCHCATVKLSSTQLNELKNRYANCLCATCLAAFALSAIDENGTE